MLCKKCGAEIRREDRRADGTFVCPGCGAVYRAKAKSASDGPAEKPASEKAAKSTSAKSASGGESKARSASGGKGAARGGKRGAVRVRWGLVAAVAAVALVAVAVSLALILGARGGKEDVVAEAPVATATATAAPAATPTPTPTEEPTPTPNPEVSVNFRAVGDVMVHKLQMSNAYKGDGKFDFAPQFEYVKDALSKADYTIANLELSIAADKEYTSFPFFRSPEEILPALKDAGVDMLTLANNHILDGFYDGLMKTLDSVDEYGFDRVGAYHTKKEAKQPLVVDINGIRFGFLAYTKDINDNDKRIEAEKAKGCVKRFDQADFKSDVKELRELGAEVVICLVHWGDEGRRSVPNSCKQWAQKLVNAGVDIILGSHPHVVLPINVGELDVNGEKKDVLIVWSMGNFISYMAKRYMDSGIIVDFTVTRDSNGKIHIHDVGYVPVYVCGSQRNFRLVCSGDFYGNKPDGMSSGDYSRMKQSVREIEDMIGQKGVTMLQN